jgi:maltooligosyltrehalose trehalohydrolase
MRRALTGDKEGYFAAFDGSSRSLARTIRQGWLRGSDPAGVDYSKFVYCLQNHDQIGNRALGDRLHHALDAATYRAASALLLLLPQTPLLFMGQEWAASTPFLYFTDHNEQLGALVTEGRRNEFAEFSVFSGAGVPDPQAEETFLRSRLRWEELATEPHTSVLRLYRSLLHLRRTDPALRAAGSSPHLQIEAVDDDTLLLHRTAEKETAGLLAVIRLRGSGEVDLNGASILPNPIWTSEDSHFAAGSEPISLKGAGPSVQFSRPGAIVFRTVPTRQA